MTEGTVLTNIPTAPPPKPIITMVTFPSSLKLTSTNYLSWKTQLDAILQGLDLYKFIDGSYLAPSPTTNKIDFRPRKVFDEGTLVMGLLIVHYALRVWRRLAIYLLLV